MSMKRLVSTLLFFVIEANASPYDSACNPLLAASEARMKQPAWHSVTIINGSMRMESVKINGSFFLQRDGKWMASPVNIDVAEKEMLAQIRSGEIKITQCKSAGGDIVDGIPVNVFKSRIEVRGVPAADSTLYIGKRDGLPYRQSGTSVEVSYKYKNISVPRL